MFLGKEIFSTIKFFKYSIKLIIITMKNKEKTQISKEPISKETWTAKKDHIIVQNKFKLVIKKGDIIKNLPEKYIETLKTEQVI